MTLQQRLNLRGECVLVAEEAARARFDFVKNNMPEWAVGHEDEIKQLLQHYAGIGCSATINHLTINGKL